MAQKTDSFRNNARSRPEVSVVMSIYNAVDSLQHTIDSILGQQDMDLQFIIVNDGSTDKSEDILSRYADQDRRVQIISQENQGLTRALIRGCALARGKYIARQDAGDISLPYRLKKQLSFMEQNHNVVLLSCGTRFVGPEGEHLYDILQTNDDTVKGLTLLDLSNIRGPSHHGNTMFRKAAYEKAGGYRKCFQTAQDWDLWTRLVEHGEYGSLPEVLYQASLNPQSISSLRRKQQIDTFRVIMQCTNLRRTGREEHAVLEEFANISGERPDEHLRWHYARFYYFVASCLRIKDPSKSRYYYWKAIKSNPVHIKATMRFLQSLLTGLVD